MTDDWKIDKGALVTTTTTLNCASPDSCSQVLQAGCGYSKRLLFVRGLQERYETRYETLYPFIYGELSIWNRQQSHCVF